MLIVPLALPVPATLAKWFVCRGMNATRIPQSGLLTELSPMEAADAVIQSEKLQALHGPIEPIFRLKFSDGREGYFRLSANGC